MASKAGGGRQFRIVGQGDDGDEPTGSTTEPRPPLTLADLRLMSTAELDRRYRAAETPVGVKDLDGPLAGALLTFSGPLSEGLARAATHRIAGSDRFPWAGKTFQSWAEDRGSGVNRVRLFGERLWFHFETRIEPSVVDGAPCVVLDYAHADNPWVVRQIRDELREVGPGLFLGPATIRGLVVLYFAVHSS